MWSKRRAHHQYTNAISTPGSDLRKGNILTTKTTGSGRFVALFSKAQFRQATFLAIVSLLLYCMPQSYVREGWAYNDSPSAARIAGGSGNPSYIACTLPSSSLVLAGYQAWHGLLSHPSSPYNSSDSAVITRHIKAAKEQCIDGFVVNWYGPADGLSNDTDRAFIDTVTEKLLQQAAEQNFTIGLMYDEGTVLPPRPAMEQVLRDLQYAQRYFSMPAYLRIGGQPALFLFPYEAVDPFIDWSEVRQQLTTSITFIDKDPNPDDPTHDAQFDGFYAWVQPSTPPGWDEKGVEWGEGYLHWFYPTMQLPIYQMKVRVGGVWPGFDDTLAPPPWRQGRYIWPRCGQTWQNTWSLVREYQPPVVLIATWNDFEEGTDIENGVGICLTSPRSQEAKAGSKVVYHLTLTNTGKFTDTFTIQTASSLGWKTTHVPNSVYTPPGSSGSLTVTLTVPPNIRSGIHERVLVTATSELSTTVYNTATITTTVLPYYIHLPAIRRKF